MKNKYIIIYILMLFSCTNKENNTTNTSCNKQNNNKYNTNITTENLRNIHLDPSSKGYIYDDLIDSISYVKLQTTDNNLMAYVNKIFFTKDKIIIVDYQKTKTIFVYNNNGDYLYKISCRGEGPDEYRTLDYATLSLDKSQIVVVDMGANKLKYFSIEDDIAKLTGSFLVKSVDLPYTFSNVEFLTEDIITGYYSGGNKVSNISDLHLFMLCSLDKKVYYSGYKSYYSNKFTYTTECPLQRFESTLFFNPSFNDTIFTISQDNISAHYVLDIKDHENIVINDKVTDNEFERLLHSNNYFNSYFIELNDIAIFNYHSNSNRYTWGLYVKSEDKTYNCNGKFQNPIMSYCHEQSFYYKGNTLVKPVSTSSLLFNKKAILEKWNCTNAKDLFENLTEDDNPVLLFYHMKTKIN